MVTYNAYNLLKRPISVSDSNVQQTIAKHYCCEVNFDKIVSYGNMG